MKIQNDFDAKTGWQLALGGLIGLAALAAYAKWGLSGLAGFAAASVAGYGLLIGAQRIAGAAERRPTLTERYPKFFEQKITIPGFILIGLVGGSGVVVTLYVLYQTAAFERDLDRQGEDAAISPREYSARHDEEKKAHERFFEDYDEWKKHRNRR